MRPVTSRVVWRLAGVAAAVALLQAVPHGQDAPLPAASEIVAKFVTAIGGAAAHKAVSSIHATGTFELVGQNMAGTVELYSARPNKQLVRARIPAIGLIESGFDGKVGWELDPTTGPALLTGRRLREAADDDWFDAALHAPDHVQSMTTTARTTFANRPAYEIHVVHPSDTEEKTEENEFYDVETHLLLGSEDTRELPIGVLPTTIELREYRKFGALLQPTEVSERSMGYEQVLHLTSYEYNKVPASTFDPPPPIKALINK